MNNKKAKEILSLNALDLSNAGMDYIPVKTVEIDTFEIMNKTQEGDGEPKWYEKATLIGLIDENKERSETYQCQSFIVRVHHTHYYRDYFWDAMEVIEALRTVHNWQSPYPDESFTVTF